MFYGWEDYLPITPGPPQLHISAHPYRLNEKEFLRGGNNVVLYHLHGSLSWLRGQTTADIYKAHQLDDLRVHDLFHRWAEGDDLLVRPLVVLGNNKQKAVLQAPFSWAYRQLRNSTSEARCVLIGGYGFRDIPLNDALREGLHAAARSNLNPRWLIVGHATTAAQQDTFRRIVEAVLDLAALGANAGNYVTFFYDGLSTASNQIDPSWWCPPQPEEP
jgi:hypothetical protein